jgi:hypothetical protein
MHLGAALALALAPARKMMWLLYSRVSQLWNYNRNIRQISATVEMQKKI